MGMNLRIGSAVAALALALTLGHSTLALAAGEISLVQESIATNFEASRAPASDDIYAVLPPEAHFGGPGDPTRGPGGPPPGGGGGWGYGPGRGVQCQAVNGRGIVFYGQGRNMPEARDAALWNCQRFSRQCWMDGCNPI